MKVHSQFRVGGGWRAQGTYAVKLHVPQIYRKSTQLLLNSSVGTGSIAFPSHVLEESNLRAH